MSLKYTKITLLTYTTQFTFLCVTHTNCITLRNYWIKKAAPQVLGNARNKLALVANSAFLWIYIQNMLQWHDHSIIPLRKLLSFHSWNEQYLTENPCYSTCGPIPYFLNTTHTSFWSLHINFLRRDVFKINQYLKMNFKKFIHLQHSKNVIWVYWITNVLQFVLVYLKKLIPDYLFPDNFAFWSISFIQSRMCITFGGNCVFPALYSV